MSRLLVADARETGLDAIHTGGVQVQRFHMVLCKGASVVETTRFFSRDRHENPQKWRGIFRTEGDGGSKVAKKKHAKHGFFLGL